MKPWWSSPGKPSPPCCERRNEALELTAAALTDLRSIRRYTLKTWGEEQTAHYIDQIWQTFSCLLAEPGRYRFRHDLFPRCQIAAVGRHVVLFRVESGTLQVVRVLHSAMDYSRHARDV